MARIIGVVVQNVCAWRIPSIPAPPAPNRHSKVTFQTGKLFSCSTINRPPFPCCVVTPPTEMTRKGWEASSSCRRKNRSQLLAVRAPGANWQLLSREGLLWEQPGYCWLPSAWLDSPLNPLTNVSAGPIHLKLLDSKISPIHIQSPKDHLPSLISNCPKTKLPTQKHNLPMAPKLTISHK